ncbi:MAG: LPS export ABC transporter permease LptG [Desulfobacterales bacterium]|nr:LPS export ABC transporter permease LptG [Desulfobacterales bacterium]
MSILDRYIIVEVIKHFAMVLIAGTGIYLVVDFFENVDNFLAAGLTVMRMLQFLQLKLPLITAQITPVGILLAVLITFGLMNKNNEIIALKSGGMSVYSLIRPIFYVGLFSTIFLFLISEIMVPLTIAKANDIYRVEVKKYTQTRGVKDIWFKSHRCIVFISYFNPKKNTISGVTLNFFDARFRLQRRVDAVEGQFQQGRWVLHDIMEQELNENSGTYDTRFIEKNVENIDFMPEDLQRVAKKSEEMSFKELLRYIQDVESEGYDATPYRVDLHGKFALPLACLIVCLIGAGITVRKVNRHGLSVNIALGIVVIFLYWIVHSFCLSLGHGGMLPPVVAAWMSNFIFACFAVYSLLNAE